MADEEESESEEDRRERASEQVAGYSELELHHGGSDVLLNSDCPITEFLSLAGMKKV